MELERFPKAMPLREERDACRGAEELLSPIGGPLLPVSVAPGRAARPRAPTRPPGRSGGPSATMVWFWGSLVTGAARLLPALLDMSEVGLRHRRAGSAEPTSTPPWFPITPHSQALNPEELEPTYFWGSSLEVSSGTCPVTGCRNVFRLSLWLWRQRGGLWLLFLSPCFACSTTLAVLIAMLHTSTRAGSLCSAPSITLPCPH